MASIWANSADRVAHCHRQAARLRRFAESEPDARFRRGVLELARQYERIAEKIDGGVDDPAVARLAASFTADE
ncbi:MAG TPA: hypothetical protein VGR91_03165 [Stellaceae bacterium]|nr:hypothetical protein [Stellaceae bacterium]